MTLRNAHHEIKAWGRAHDREIDHESIFTLKGYPRREGPAAQYLRMPGDSENAQKFSFHSQNARKIEKKVRIRDSVES